MHVDNGREGLRGWQSFVHVEISVTARGCFRSKSARDIPLSDGRSFGKKSRDETRREPVSRVAKISLSDSQALPAFSGGLRARGSGSDEEGRAMGVRMEKSGKTEILLLAGCSEGEEWRVGRGRLSGLELRSSTDAEDPTDQALSGGYGRIRATECLTGRDPRSSSGCSKMPILREFEKPKRGPRDSRRDLRGSPRKLVTPDLFRKLWSSENRALRRARVFRFKDSYP